MFGNVISYNRRLESNLEIKKHKRTDMLFPLFKFSIQDISCFWCWKLPERRKTARAFIFDLSLLYLPDAQWKQTNEADP